MCDLLFLAVVITTSSLSIEDALEEELRIALTTGVMPEDEKAFPSGMDMEKWAGLR